MNFANLALPRDLVLEFAPSQLSACHAIAPSQGVAAEFEAASADSSAGKRHLVIALALVAAIAAVVMAAPF